jgi:hypothetical protein
MSSLTAPHFFQWQVQPGAEKPCHAISNEDTRDPRNSINYTKVKNRYHTFLPIVMESQSSLVVHRVIVTGFQTKSKGHDTEKNVMHEGSVGQKDRQKVYKANAYRAPNKV